jgi:hypothetical protein
MIREVHKPTYSCKDCLDSFVLPKVTLRFPCLWYGKVASQLKELQHIRLTIRRNRLSNGRWHCMADFIKSSGIMLNKVNWWGWQKSSSGIIGLGISCHYNRKETAVLFSKTPKPSLRAEEKRSTFYYCWDAKSSFKLVWKESTSSCNSMMGHSLKWRCCSVIWSISFFWQKQIFTLYRLYIASPGLQNRIRWLIGNNKNHVKSLWLDKAISIILKPL